MINKPVLSYINKEEALSYLGYRKHMDINKTEVIQLLYKYEKLLLENIQPRYIYKSFSISELSDILIGNDINEHISGCDNVILMCLTLGVEADKLIRKAEINDISGAVILDALAGAAIEQICDICEKDIKSHFPDTTERYSPGYGDFPLELQNDFLNKLDANRKIGLYANENNILIPRKSVTAVIGLKTGDRKG